MRQHLSRKGQPIHANSDGDQPSGGATSYLAQMCTFSVGGKDCYGLLVAVLSKTTPIPLSCKYNCRDHAAKVLKKDINILFTKRVCSYRFGNKHRLKGWGPVYKGERDLDMKPDQAPHQLLRVVDGFASFETFLHGSDETACSNKDG